MKSLSMAEVQKLPTMEELLKIIELNRKCFELRGGWQFGDGEMYDKAKYMGLCSSFAPYCNYAGRDKFIVSRLRSKRFCFKPNLANAPFLFRGQNREYPHIASAFERQDDDGKIISNLKTLDFAYFVKTHPLCRMFDNGIALPSVRKTFFFEMNYYGLAQHYNFNTGLIDFSINPLVAAFFATTQNLGNDVYVPIEDTTKYPYGVIYIHSIIPKITFQCFSTIGQQVFPRTGAQYGFFFQEKQCNINVGAMVRKLYFRHDAKCSRNIYSVFGGGRLLFPKDDLSGIAAEINASKDVSLSSFTENLYVNTTASISSNLDACRRKGINVNPHLLYMFTPELLRSYYQDIKNGFWEEFCRPIFFHAPKGEVRLKDELLNLPKDPHYRQYFDERYADELYNYQLNLVRQRNNSLQRNTIR